jgi:CRP/FNR family transcriptional regulator
MKTRPLVNIQNMKVSCGSCSLSELCLPRGLSATELDELDNVVHHKRKLERGSYLFRAGAELKAIYAVRSGSLKTTLSTSDGAEQVTGFHLPGELLGLDGLGDDLHTCNAQALESTTVCELPYQEFEALCGQIDGLRRQVMHLVGKEIAQDHRMLLALGKMAAEERLATFLLSLSRRYRLRGFSELEFNLTMPRHDLANYLGLAVETVSRLFSRMQDEGLLAVQRRSIQILDMDGLRRLAHEECE